MYYSDCGDDLGYTDPKLSLILWKFKDQACLSVDKKIGSEWSAVTVSVPPRLV